MVLHFDGEIWSTVAVEPPHEIRLKVVGRGPDDVYVAGIYGLIHFDGEVWTPVDTPRALFVPRALAIVDDRETLFAGSRGAIARRMAFFTADFGYGLPCVWTRVEPAVDCDLSGLPLEEPSPGTR